MARSIGLFLGVLAASLALIAVTLIPIQSSRAELFSRENRFGSLAASPDAKAPLESQTKENLVGSLSVSPLGTEHDVGGMLTDKALEDEKNTQGSLLQKSMAFKPGKGKKLAEVDSNMAGFLADLNGEDEDRNMQGIVAAIVDPNEERNRQGTLSVLTGDGEERNNLGTVSFIDKAGDDRNRDGTLSLAVDGDHINMIGSVDAVTSTKLDEYNANGDLLNVDDSKDPVNRDGE
jgi:hypothetical protein